MSDEKYECIACACACDPERAAISAVASCILSGPRFTADEMFERHKAMLLDCISFVQNAMLKETKQ